MRTSHLCLFVSLAAVCHSMADERLTGIACRSVHLQYQAVQPASAYYNSARVTDSAPGSYFMTNGWNGGYFGMQELGDGKKVVLFSLWDAHHTHDPKALDESQRTRAEWHAPDVRVGRFGGEGTGGQSFFDYDWKRGETYRFLVCVQDVGDGRAAYTGFFHLPERKEWKRLVTFSSPTAPKQINGPHSFVEDFRRNRESTKFLRRAEFNAPAIRLMNGEWQRVKAAKFTADGNKAENIDAGAAAGGWVFLATGGEIKNQTCKLWGTFELPVPAADSVPADVRALADEFLKPAAQSTPAKHSDPQAK